MFGGFRVELDGKPLTVFRTDKNRALLAYLALESEHSHRREALANLLWSDHNQSAARNSLRQAIYQLRQIIDLDSKIEPHLLITPNEVQFNEASDYWIDATEFKNRLSTCQSHHPSSLSLNDDILKNIQFAIDLYQGEMLTGFTLPRCSEFTDWQIINQEIYHHEALTALTLLADYFEANHKYDQLITYTQRKIELEPWRESAYRRQMWALAMTGQREQALLRYKSLEEVLLHELGISPSDQIKRLFNQIRDGDLPGLFAIQGKFSFSLTSAFQSFFKCATPFVDRQSELAQLDVHLRKSLTSQGRIAFISGEAGSGKTTLMNEFARRALRTNNDLLVASGTCSAYNGLGDPFQPFREILESMVGINAMPSSENMLSQECARRLSIARPALLQTLLETSPSLIGTFLSTQDLLNHARETTGIEAVLVARLENLAEHQQSEQKATINPNSKMAWSPSVTFDLMQLRLYDQVARLLRAISYRFPILILLDDLQWVDNASASLLFHLRSYLSGSRILDFGGIPTREHSIINRSGATPIDIRSQRISEAFRRDPSRSCSS